MLNLTNSIYNNAPVSIGDILRQLQTIPVATERIIYKMMTYELTRDKYHTTPQSENELIQHCIDFGRTLKTSSISPQALYFLYIINSQSNSKKNKNKSKKSDSKISSETKQNY